METLPSKMFNVLRDRGGEKDSPPPSICGTFTQALLSAHCLLGADVRTMNAHVCEGGVWAGR